MSQDSTGVPNTDTSIESNVDPQASPVWVPQFVKSNWSVMI